MVNAGQVPFPVWRGVAHAIVYAIRDATYVYAVVNASGRVHART